MIGEKPTERQIAFATEISETIGMDLPEEYTKDAYRNFIDNGIDEFRSMWRTTWAEKQWKKKLGE